MKQLTRLDFPAPVAPAISTCGIVGQVHHLRAAVDVLAERHGQRVGRLASPPSIGGCRRASRSRGALFGTSTPIADLPGIGAMMRTSGVASA